MFPLLSDVSMFEVCVLKLNINYAKSISLFLLFFYFYINR